MKRMKQVLALLLSLALLLGMAAVAQVSSKGKITAKAPGTAIITVKGKTSKQDASCTITVIPASTKGSILRLQSADRRRRAFYEGKRSFPDLKVAATNFLTYRRECRQALASRRQRTNKTCSPGNGKLRHCRETGLFL